jgi:hypothetical protein
MVAGLIAVQAKNGLELKRSIATAEPIALEAPSGHPGQLHQLVGAIDLFNSSPFLA